MPNKVVLLFIRVSIVYCILLVPLVFFHPFAYAACTPPSDYSGCPPSQQPDINLNVRGWKPTSGTMGLFYYSHETDSAPYLNTLVEGNGHPAVTSLYQVNPVYWDNSSFNQTPPGAASYASLVGFQTQPGQNLLTPYSAYDIGGGHSATVLYADQNQITIKYGTGNTIEGTYAIHLININVDPQILSLYNQLSQAGGTESIVLDAGEILGQAKSGEILVAVRDQGSFMDPRWQNDWWPFFDPATGRTFLVKKMTTPTTVSPPPPQCSSSVSDSSSRPSPCINCTSRIFNAVGSCAQTPTINGEVHFRWDAGSMCGGTKYVEKTWGGSVSVDPTSVDIPFAGKKGSENEKKFLADYFEGTGYYYSPPYDFTKQIDRERAINEGGVFRKLAPADLQDEYRKNMVYRAQRSQQGREGSPIHNYLVSYAGKTAKLTDFIGHFPPERKNFTSEKEFSDKYNAWSATDWGKLWPAVPMFSREDANGRIDLSLQSPYDEFTITTPDKNQVIKVPHVIRLYEVASAVQSLLLPKEIQGSAALPSGLSDISGYSSPSSVVTNNNSENDSALLASSVLMAASNQRTLNSQTSQNALLAQASQCFTMSATSNVQNNGNGTSTVSITLHLYSPDGGGDGHINCLSGCNLHNTPWNKGVHNPYDISPEWTGGSFVVSAGQPTSRSYNLTIDRCPNGIGNASTTCSYSFDATGKLVTNCTSSGLPPQPACGTTKSDVDMCSKQSITGEGDKLCCGQISANFKVTELVENHATKPEHCGEIGYPSSACDVSAGVDRKLEVILQLPLLGRIWQKTAEKTNGVFNLFRPQDTQQFKDTYAKSQSNVKYSASGGEVTGIDPSSGEFYYPHLGGVQEAKEWLTKCLLVPGNKNNPLCGSVARPNVVAPPSGDQNACACTMQKLLPSYTKGQTFTVECPLYTDDPCRNSFRYSIEGISDTNYCFPNFNEDMASNNSLRGPIDILPVGTYKITASFNGIVADQEQFTVISSANTNVCPARTATTPPPTKDCSTLYNTSACPVLSYSINFRDPNDKIPDNLKSTIVDKVGSRFGKTLTLISIDTLNLVERRAQAAGWSPKFVTALWIEETGASATVQSGKSADALGCLPTTHKNLDQSLSCLFNNFSTENDFAGFMLRYSSLKDRDVYHCFCTNPNFPGGIHREYNFLNNP